MIPLYLVWTLVMYALIGVFGFMYGKTREWWYLLFMTMCFYGLFSAMRALEREVRERKARSRAREKKKEIKNDDDGIFW